MIRRVFLQAIRRLDARLKSASMRLTKWTGKSPVRIHPKHLVGSRERQEWYARHTEGTDALLDAGCGIAGHALRAAESCRLVVGFDACGSDLSIGGRLAREQRAGNVRLVQANAEDGWPFASGSFDKVLFLDVLEHLNERQGALREAYRVLRDEGAMFLSAPNRDTRWKRRLRSAGLPYFTDSDHKIEYSLEELSAELEAGGFRVDGEFEPIVYDTPLAGLIDALGGLSLRLYAWLSRYRREGALRHPEESTGWQVVCRKQAAPS
jgi:SAM-dependent methyltransferase